MQYSNDTWTLDDNFGMGRAGDQVARITLEAEPPFTLGITGKWGSGKTSVTRRAFVTLNYMLPRIASICAKNSKAYEYLAQSIASFYEPEELLAMMREAGFSKVDRKELTFGIVSIYVGIK